VSVEYGEGDMGKEGVRREERQDSKDDLIQSRGLANGDDDVAYPGNYPGNGKTNRKRVVVIVKWAWIAASTVFI
jgi:hypothetical protein